MLLARGGLARLARLAPAPRRSELDAASTGTAPPAVAPDERARLVRFLGAWHDLRAVRDRLPLADLLRRAVAALDLDAALLAAPDGERRAVNLEKAIALAARFEADGGRAPELARHLRALAARPPREPEAELEVDDAVAILSVHQAKGLEWPIVLVPDLGAAGRADGAPRPPRRGRAALRAALRRRARGARRDRRDAARARGGAARRGGRVAPPALRRAHPRARSARPLRRGRARRGDLARARRGGGRGSPGARPARPGRRGGARTRPRRRSPPATPRSPRRALAAARAAARRRRARAGRARRGDGSRRVRALPAAPPPRPVPAHPRAARRAGGARARRPRPGDRARHARARDARGERPRRAAARAPRPAPGRRGAARVRPGEPGHPADPRRGGAVRRLRGRAARSRRPRATGGSRARSRSCSASAAPRRAGAGAATGGEGVAPAAYLVGAIDALVAGRRGEGIVLVDYKYATPRPGAAERYRLQLLAYTLAARRAHPGARVRARLQFLRGDLRAVDVTATERELDAFAREAPALALGAYAGTGGDRPPAALGRDEARCRAEGCGYVARCFPRTLRRSVRGLDCPHGRVRPVASRGARRARFSA